MIIFVAIFAVTTVTLSYIAKTAWGKGKLGEWWVKQELERLDENKYEVFYNVTIKDSRGETQIDFIVVSKYGIFVIEVKNYAGYIYGGTNQKTWTQHLFGKNFKFQNPIRQNYRHIMALLELLELEKENFHNVVYFVGTAKLRGTYEPNVMAKGCRKYIESFTDEILDFRQVAKTKQKLIIAKYAK